MAINTDDIDMRQIPRFQIYPFGILEVDTKFVFFQAGGDIRVCFCIDVWINSKRYACNTLDSPRYRIELVQLLFRLNIKTMNIGSKRQFHFLCEFPHSRKYDFACVATCTQHALQFTAGDNVKTRAQSCQHIQHSQIRICLYRVTDQMVTTGECRIKRVPMPFQCRT